MIEIIQFMLIAVLAGFLGSLVGLGGGIIITPALTILFGIDIKYAIGASIIAVIATSSGSAIAFVKDHISNMRVGMLLEVFTTAGGVDLKVVSPKTCSHKKIENLYFAGEILDLHGEIGGYNLMVAWFTGMVVADAIKEKYGIE